MKSIGEISKVAALQVGFREFSTRLDGKSVAAGASTKCRAAGGGTDYARIMALHSTIKGGSI